jgi:predicted ATPase/transcriptional regulator with XRE-family HTH domain
MTDSESKPYSRSQKERVMDAELTFGQWLRRTRRAYDLTQAELAVQAGCAVGTLRKLEADELIPSKQLAVRLANVFGIPAAERAAFVAYARGQADPPPALPRERHAATSAPSILPPRRHNLPISPTTFIGRAGEVALVRDRLRQPDVHLLTLTGPGGTGKTRLALQVATTLLDDFADGVWFMDLAPIRDSALVVSIIASAFQLLDSGGAMLADRLLAYLSDKQLLLLLDNFEQVVEAAPLLAELLAAAPQLRLLVTSRVVVGVYGEYHVPVPPLNVPGPQPLPPLDHLVKNEAVQLFLVRAQAATGRFLLTPANAPLVVELCQHLDGLPLAIELAAARLRHLPLETVLGRLSSRLTLLTGGARTLPQRQQTLRDTLTWSYDLLTPDEQRLFRRLAVFVGGWTLEAAEAVCNVSGDLPFAVLDGLATLLDQSLLRQAEGVNGEPRFTMLETIREYALERLTEHGEVEKLRQQHAENYLALAEAAQPEADGLQRRTWLERLEAEHDNLRAALEYLSAHEASEHLARLCAALTWFWWLRGDFRVARAWVNQMVARRDQLPAPLRAKALLRCVRLFHNRADVAFALLEEGLTLYRTLGDQHGIAEALIELGVTQAFYADNAVAGVTLEEGLALSRTVGYTAGIAMALGWLGKIRLEQGDAAGAAALLEESLLLYQRLGNSNEITTVLAYLGWVAELQGDYQRANARYAEALARRQQMGDRRGIAAMLAILGNVALKQGDIAQAVALQTESLDIYRVIWWRPGIGWALQAFGTIAGMLGQADRAARLLGAEEALRDEDGYKIVVTTRDQYDHILTSIQATLGTEVFATAWSAGRAMTLDQALAEVELLRLALTPAAPIPPAFAHTGE